MNFLKYNRRHRNSVQNQNQKTKPDPEQSSRALNPCQKGKWVLFHWEIGCRRTTKHCQAIAIMSSEKMYQHKQKQKGPVSDLLALQKNRTEEQNHSGIQIPSWDIVIQEEKLSEFGEEMLDITLNPTQFRHRFFHLPCSFIGILGS